MGHVTVFIHRLFTILDWLMRDNLWVSCGSICTKLKLTWRAFKMTIYISEQQV